MEVFMEEVDEIWGELQAGMQEAYGHRHIASERYVQLYSFVYNYCSKGSKPVVVNEEDRVAWKQRRLNSSQRNVLPPSVYTQETVSSDLYHRIQNMIKDHLVELTGLADGMNGEDLVKFYISQWELFTFSSKVVNGFCSYLNRHWITPMKRKEKNNVQDIYSLALEIWKTSFFEPLRMQVISFILQLIQRNRQGESVDLSLIKGITSSLVELGSDPDSPADQVSDDLTIYRRKFEDAFIAETADFYALESSRLWSLGTVSDYMKTVENHFIEEQRRVQTVLHDTTLERLMKTCQRVLIVDRLPTFQEEFPKLLNAEDMEGMARMYKLICKIPNSFGRMMKQFHERVAAAGREAVKENRELCSKSPVEYITTILGVYKKYNELVSGPFQKCPGFAAAFDQGCQEYINQNDLTTEPSSAHRSPVTLAKYCDFLLKRSGKVSSDEQLEELLNEAVFIFKLIEDKDVFQQYYSSFLAKRLIDELSTSDDAESAMITKLKIACGYEYTNKLHNMFKDMSLSRDKNVEFRDWMEQKGISLKVDFSVKILTSGSWPYKAAKKEFAFPKELEPCVSNFNTYYKEKTQGRNLIWMHGNSRGEVVSEKSVFGGTSYTFVVPTYGITILLLYNSRDSYTIKGLCEATQLDQATVVPVAGQLMKASLLKSTENFDKLTPTSEIQLNLAYKSKKRKINVAVPMKADIKRDDDENQSKVEEGRKYEVQATIVRIMKTRKVLGMQLIISEVGTQMQGRFTPSVPLIKASIKTLVEKDYLKPQKDDPNILEYVA